MSVLSSWGNPVLNVSGPVVVIAHILSFRSFQILGKEQAEAPRSFLYRTLGGFGLQGGKLVSAHSRTHETHRLTCGWKFPSKPSRGVPSQRQWEQRFQLSFQNPNHRDCCHALTWKWDLTAGSPDPVSATPPGYHFLCILHTWVFLHLLLFW